MRVHGWNDGRAVTCWFVEFAFGGGLPRVYAVARALQFDVVASVVVVSGKFAQFIGDRSGFHNQMLWLQSRFFLCW